ncbi:MAG: hypothetical protein E6Q97_26530 [Desulfurellales bacterium]|nr:MAG: hypothetical protein E6Q97_26530 [Desulfurellales bacterium]
MPVPSNPTLSVLIAEGFSKAGVDNPGSTLTTRATDVWAEEIKDDIIQRSGRKLKPLYTERIAICTIGVSKYDNPSDFLSDMSLEMLDGDTGTAQAGSSSTVTLSATEANTDLIGKEIVITSGVGVGQIRQIISYDTSTKIATVSDDFDTSPDATSGYMLVKYKSPVYDDIPSNMALDQSMMQSGKATRYYPIGTSTYGAFVLNRVPDKAYAIRQRYYADLKRIDTDGSLISTLYDKWRNVWTLGIAWRAAEHENTVDRDRFEVQYQREIAANIPQEIDGKDVNWLTERVGDYL